jgi:hypothetical protein
MTSVRRWLAENPGIRVAVWFHLPLIVYAIAAMPFDHRVILGLNPWVKPLKFDASVVVFLVTAAGILSGVVGWRRSRLVIGWGIGIAMMVEDFIISMQSFRGVRSHMNYGSAFDATAFSIMGVFIAINTLLVTWLLVLVCFNRTEWPKAIAWGVRLGLLALVAGSMEGVLMVMHGAHTVGAADGSPGLFFVNWSRQYGDLRVAHFFAIHALQAMPLLGWMLTRTSLTRRTQVLLVVAGFLAYMAVTGMLFQQAMAGHPVF